MNKWLLIAVILLAIVLRFPGLSQLPIGFNADEASFGYDAYSLLQTGKDQWGHSFPLALESFGDFKAPLYSYIDIPFVAVMGLTQEAVRFPGALLGVGAVWILYLLVKRLTDDANLSFLAAFLLAISPWHIQLSRGAFESNLSSFFMPLGVLFFLKGLRKHRYLYLSALVFGINLFTYHSAKVVTPLIVIFLIFIFKKDLKELYKAKSWKIYLAGVVFIFFMLLTASTFLQGAGRRASDVSILNGALESQAMRRLEAIESGTNPTVARALNNKYFVMINRFLYNYKSYFSLNYLFKDGARETTYGMLPKVGVLYWFELPFLFAFLMYFGAHYKKQKSLQIILFWLLVSPIPASLTSGIGHAGNRAATMMPALQLASAFGAYYLITFLRRMRDIRQFYLACTVAVVVIVFSVVSFFQTYLLFSPAKMAKGMLYGNIEVAHWLAQNANDKTKIVVSRSLSEPQIFVAFANKWNPLDYQKHTVDWGRYREQNLKFLDQLDSYSLGKYEFKSIEKEDYELSNSIIVGRPEEFTKDVTPIKIFYYPDKTPSIYVVTIEE